MNTTIERRTGIVTIYQGDYLDRIRDLERRAEAAEAAAGPRRAGETPEYLTIAREHDELVKEAEESALHVKVQALGRRAWKQLVGEHPPREGNEADALYGVNEDTFKEVLVSYVDEADPENRTIVEPQLTEADLDSLADIDFDRIFLMAFSLNRGTVAAPKASLASRLSQRSDETSS